MGTLATKKMERTERESWSLIDSIPAPIATLTKAGEVDMVNRRLLEYFGTTIEKVRQWGTNDLVHPQDLPQMIDLFTRSIESCTPFESDQRLRHRDGVYRWFRAAASPLRDAEGQVVRWCVVLTDIDDRKRAEDGLRTNERNLQLIIDTIPALAWSALPDGSAEFFNRSYLEYTGLTAEQVRGWSWTVAIHPDDLGSLAAAWQRIMASEAPGETEARIRRFDGAYRWFLFRANPLRDESGNIVKWYGTNVDIEDRKRGEEALHARELSWRQIVDNIPGLVATMGAMGEVEFLNRQTLEYFGRTKEDLKDWALIDAIHPDDLPRVIETRVKSIETGQIYEVEHRCRRADGVYRWFQVRGLPVRNSEGTVTTWYLLLTDIDDRKHAEENLKRSEAFLAEGQRLSRTGSFSWNMATGEITWSDQLYRIFEFDQHLPVTLGRIGSRVYADDLPLLQDMIERAQAAARDFEYGHRLLMPDESVKHIHLFAHATRDKYGRLEYVGAAQDVTDQQQLLQKLRQSEQDLRTIIDTIRQIIVVLAPDGTTLYANQVAFDFSGLNVNELDGKGFMESVCQPDALNRVLDRRRVGMLEGVPFETETCVLFKRTQYRWVLLQYNPLKDENGQIIRWYATATDIDDRKKAEEALRSSERNLSLMINAIPCWSDVFSGDGAILYRNQTVSDYTGFPLEETRKEDFRARVFHPEDLKGLEELRLALTRPVPFENEQRVLAKDGRYRWFLFRHKPLLDEQGRIERWYSAGFDIDDRKRAEAEVEQAYLRLAEAQQLSKTGSFITDLVGDNHNWSEETFRIFEFDPAAKVTVHMIRDLVHSEDLPSFDAMIARAMTGTGVDFVFRIVTSGGTVKHIRGMARILTQIEGHPLFIGALQDVTDRKVSEEALDRARAELAHVSRITTLNALTGSIAHEINQPLSGIVTNAGTCLRMLDSDPPNIDGARETARRTLRDGNRAADVISRLRALFSKKEFTLEPLDLNEVTREVISLSVSDLQRNRVTLKVELAEGLPSVIGDRVQLQQVMLNLLRNASDAMASIDERPRDLVIRTLPEGDDRARLSVEDTGIGLPPQDLQKLFEAFYTTKNGGMGIGLSVSRSIIQRHHGRLWAEANNGPGATFSFSIPCVSDAEANTAKQ